jgi:hypothetical protein
MNQFKVVVVVVVEVVEVVVVVVVVVEVVEAVVFTRDINNFIFQFMIYLLRTDQSSIFRPARALKINT